MFWNVDFRINMLLFVIVVLFENVSIFMLSGVIVMLVVFVVLE